MATNATSTNFGTSKKKLSRKEVYLTNETIDKLDKRAAAKNCSTKALMELILTNYANR